MSSFFSVDWKAWPVVVVRILKSSPTSEEFQSYLDIYTELYKHGQKFSIMIVGAALDWYYVYEHAKFNLAHKAEAQALTNRCAVVTGLQGGTWLNQLVNMTQPPVPVNFFDTEDQAMAWLLEIQ